MFRCLLLLFVTALVFMTNPVSAAPVLVAEKSFHDFGEVIQGESTTHTFRFQNAGDEVLEISRLRSSCGCTAALLSARRLAPGELGELKVTFNSSGFRGMVQKLITFDTNDPDHPSANFSLKGNVKAELFFTPKRVNWGRVKAGRALSATLDIVNASDKVVSFTAPDVTISGITAQLSSLIINAGEKATLTVSATFPQGKRRLAGYVILRSDFSAVPELRVPVSARLSTN